MNVCKDVGERMGKHHYFSFFNQTNKQLCICRDEGKRTRDEGKKALTTTTNVRLLTRKQNQDDIALYLSSNDHLTRTECEKVLELKQKTRE